MTTARKPATPLPILRVNAAGHRGDFSIDNEDATVEFGRIASRDIAHELVRRANAHPRLVATLRSIVQIAASGHSDIRELDWKDIDALLAELGE